MLTSFLLGCVGAPLDSDVLDLDLECEDLNSDLIEVDGYERADSTWVEPYVRTAPDDTVTNNLSFWDLINA